MDEETEPTSERPKYRDKLTERFAQGERVKPFQGFKEQAERRLDLLEAATTVDDLKGVDPTVTLVGLPPMVGV